MQGLGDVGTDDGEPEQHLPVLVDDHAGLAGVVVGVQRGAGDCAQVVVDDAGSVAMLLRLGGGEPTQATSGSVKTTCGTSW